MNPRQRGRRTTDVPGPDSVAGPGPGTSTSDELPACIRCSEHVAAAGSSLCELCITDLGEHDAAEREAGAFVLVDDDELALIRWAGYDAAMEDATGQRDRAVQAASERLDKAMKAAYADYDRAVSNAALGYAAAQRAAMNAHELAHAAGQATS